MSQQVEMAFGDREMLADPLESYRCGRFQPFRPQAYLAELRGNRHGKASGMCSGQQFFGVGAYAVFKSRAERILCLVQRTAFRR